MTEQIIAIVGIVISTLSLIGSVVLLLLNKATLIEVKKQNARVVRSIESDTVSKIAASQQNMLFQMVAANTDAAKKALNGFSKTGEDNYSVYGTIMINHLNMVYTFRQKGFLGDDEWIGLQNDIKHSFERMPLLRERWTEVRTTYSTGFQKFIDDLVDRGRMGS